MTTQQRRSYNNLRTSDEVVHNILDYALANPKMTVNAITKRFHLGIGTLRNWLVPPKTHYGWGPIHPGVKEWMEIHGTDWLEQRPRNGLGIDLLQLITGSLEVTGPEDEIEVRETDESRQLQEITIVTEWDIVPEDTVFEPKTTDDLMVLEHEVQHMLDRAESTVCQLKTVLTSIQVIRQWDGDKSARIKAESKIAELENQVRLADANVKKVQEEALSAKLVDKFGKK